MRVYKVKELHHDILEYELVDTTDLPEFKSGHMLYKLLEIHGYAFDTNNQILCNIDYSGHYSAKYMDLNVVSKQIKAELRDNVIRLIDETI